MHLESSIEYKYLLNQAYSDELEDNGNYSHRICRDFVRHDDDAGHANAMMAYLVAEIRYGCKDTTSCGVITFLEFIFFIERVIEF